MDFRVSVIMGIYNCEKTLPAALDSLFAQTFTGWKLIMCDDGSADGTYAAAEEYRLKYPEKIILIKNEKNEGLNRTLNRCLALADTEYVARMDGDDLSLPERFEKEIDFLDGHPEYDIVSCPMIYFDENGDFMQSSERGEPTPSDYVRGTPFSHAPCMVRRAAMTEQGGYTEAENRLRVEDWDLWVRLREAGHRGYNLSEPLYKMRDDRAAKKRRKLKYRMNEASVIASAVKKLKLSPVNYVRCLRPVLVGLLPGGLYNVLHKLKKQVKK